jgi:hypothetical protein
VRSGHSNQSDPQTIAEIRRIMLLHLQEACGADVGCASSTAAAPAGQRAIEWDTLLSEFRAADMVRLH